MFWVKRHRSESHGRFLDHRRSRHIVSAAFTILVFGAFAQQGALVSLRRPCFYTVRIGGGCFDLLSFPLMYLSAEHLSTMVGFGGTAFVHMAHWEGTPGRKHLFGLFLLRWRSFSRPIWAQYSTFRRISLSRFASLIHG